MGILDSLISQHVKRGEMLLSGRSENNGGKKFKVKPFITFSREAGSGGSVIAKAVAKKMGFKIYHKNLIEMIAKKANKRKALIASLDRKALGFTEDIIQAMLNPDYVSKETYFKNLCKVVASVAAKGNCVILGRGANFITSGYGGLHVRVAAPFLVRAGYTAQYEGYTIYEARERMKAFDKRRKEYIQKYFGKNSSNPNYYDLVLNTTNFDIEQARDIVIDVFKKKFPVWKKGRK